MAQLEHGSSFEVSFLSDHFFEMANLHRNTTETSQRTCRLDDALDLATVQLVAGELLDIKGVFQLGRLEQIRPYLDTALVRQFRVVDTQSDTGLESRVQIVGRLVVRNITPW